jgi:hypothetical protein
MSDDLPTLDRPAIATSGNDASGAGKSLGAAAEIMNFAERGRMTAQPYWIMPSTGTLSRSRTSTTVVVTAPATMTPAATPTYQRLYHLSSA